MKKLKTQYSKLFKLLYLTSLGWLFIFFLSLFCHQLTAFNQDLGRHLKAGQIIISQKKVPKINLFSFAFPNFPFINHHWLPEVIFYLTANNLGLNSLIFLKLILLSLAFFSLLVFINKHYGKIIGLGWGLLTLFLLALRTEVRPEIFSYFFLSLYLIILSQPKIFKKYFLVLPLVQLLWVNSHIYFFLGSSLLFFYLISHLIIFKLKSKKQLLKIITALALSSLINLVNPNFLKGALYPLLVLKNYGYRVVENQSFFYMSNYYGKIYNPYFLFIFFISFLSFLITIKKQNFYAVASFLFFSFLAFMSIRNISVFALAVFILAAKNLFLTKKAFFKPRSELVLNLKLLFYFVFIPLLIFLSFQNITHQSAKYKYSIKKFGLGTARGAWAGADFVLKNKINGPIFNNFDIGSFLIFKLYPDYQVFVDGRPEAYPADFFKNTYIPMQEKPTKWEEIDKKYNFNFILFSHTDITPWTTAFLQTIFKNKNWQLVFLDDYSIIFLKQNEQNKALIEKHALDKNNFDFSCQEQIDCYARIKNILKILN